MLDVVYAASEPAEHLQPNMAELPCVVYRNNAVKGT